MALCLWLICRSHAAELITSTSVSNPSTLVAKRLHNEFDKLMAKADNNSSFSSSSPLLPLPPPSQETSSVISVLDAYKRAKQRMDRLNIISGGGVKTNEI